MLPVQPPKQKQLQINLSETIDEVHIEVADQHKEQVDAILARNKRIADKAAGIEPEPIHHEQLPVNKDQLKVKAPNTSREWTPYD